MNTIKNFGEVVVSSNADLKVEMHKRELQKDVWEYAFALEWNEEQAKASNSKVMLRWTLAVC